jgi:aerobic carbon-monoxide dehydrogenase large subunit
VSILGNRVIRTEDPLLLTAGGRYVDDLAHDPLLAGAAEVFFVRSTSAHAVISVDVSNALGQPGVINVVTSADIDLGTVPFDLPMYPVETARAWLASDRVRFVGEPIVAIIAHTRAQAADAAEHVVVDYEPLPAIIDVETAVNSDNFVHPLWGSNVVQEIKLDGEATDEDFAACDKVVRLRLVNQRIAPVTLEPRAAAASWVPGSPSATGDVAEEPTRVHFFCACQGIHGVRDQVAKIYGLTPAQVHGVTPHVGGGFGAKAMPYPEELLLPFLSRLVGSPVRWVSNRSDDMVNLGHGRGQIQFVTLGGSTDGVLQAYKLEVLADSGAYPRFGAYLPNLTRLMQSGCYNIAKQSFSSRSVLTNTTPVVAYRGAGRPEATAALERAVDVFAAAIGKDPAEVRRMNALTPDVFPVKTKTGALYDSGEYVVALDQALHLADYETIQHAQASERKANSRIVTGVGMSLYVEVTGAGGSPEYARVDVLPNGKVRALTGTSPHGQGHYTTWAMLIADRLGIEPADVEVFHGDTDIVPVGGMTGGSRSVQTGGVAMYRAAQVVAERMKELAADLLEAAPADIVFDPAAGFSVAGTPSITISWDTLVAKAYGAPTLVSGTGVSSLTASMQTGARPDAQAAEASGADGAGAAAGAFSSIEELGPLGFEHKWGSGKSTFPSGAHVAIVEVDLDTGMVKLKRMIAVDDAGRIINPLLAEGQVHGGLAQGIAQALFEEFVYDEFGNPLTSNLADYTMVSSAELPSFELGHLETASPTNELGVKGIGESGTVGAAPAVQNAVINALAHLGVTHIDMPLTPERVWSAIQLAMGNALV